MKKTIAILLTLIFVFAVTSVTFATEAKKKSAPKQATGEVAAVDAKAMTMTVKAKKGDVTVSTSDKTKFMPKGKTIADVKAGDKVTVKYTEADGKNTASSVDIKAAPVKKDMMKAAPKVEEKKAAPAAAPAAAPKAAPAKKAAGY